MYEYRVKPIRVIDGDTAQFDIDLGLNVHRIEILRFAGIDAPEMNSSDPVVRAQAHTATTFVVQILLGAQPTVQPIAIEVKVQTAKPYSTDKYGRWLGTVLYRTVTSGPNEWTNLNESLVALGYAAPYDGGAR